LSKQQFKTEYVYLDQEVYIPQSAYHLCMYRW